VQSSPGGRFPDANSDAVEHIHVGANCPREISVSLSVSPSLSVFLCSCGRVCVCVCLRVCVLVLVTNFGYC